MGFIFLILVSLEPSMHIEKAPLLSTPIRSFFKLGATASFNIQVALVLPQPYPCAILLSGNTSSNNLFSRSANDRGMLCSAKAITTLVSALVIYFNRELLYIM